MYGDARAARRSPMKRPMMQEKRTRQTFSRGRADTWVYHVDGVRKPGVENADMLALVQDLLSEPSKLRTVIIEVDGE